MLLVEFGYLLLLVICVSWFSWVLWLCGFWVILGLLVAYCVVLLRCAFMCLMVVRVG